MDIMSINNDVFYKLKNLFPENFLGLEILDNRLVFGDQAVVISAFNLNDLLSGDNNFAAQLSVFTAEDIFKIIKLHAVAANSRRKKQRGNDHILISNDTLFSSLNSSEPLNEEEKENIDYFYEYYEDLVLYEDYLTVRLKDRLDSYRNYLYQLQYGDMSGQLNDKQKEAIDKNEKIAEKVSLKSEEMLVDEVDKPKTLVKSYGNDDNLGSISILQVLAIIIGVSIILTAVTLYLIG